MNIDTESDFFKSMQIGDHVGDKAEVTRAPQLHYSVPLRIVGGQGMGKEFIRISQDGRIFWHGREVETDDDFRGAMMELAQQLASNMGVTR